MKKNTSIRVDEKKLERLKELGLALSEVVNQAVDKAINNKTCPACGQKIKGSKK